MTSAEWAAIMALRQRLWPASEVPSEQLAAEWLELLTEKIPGASAAEVAAGMRSFDATFPPALAELVDATRAVVRASIAGLPPRLERTLSPERSGVWLAICHEVLARSIVLPDWSGPEVDEWLRDLCDTRMRARFGVREIQRHDWGLALAHGEQDRLDERPPGAGKGEDPSDRPPRSAP